MSLEKVRKKEQSGIAELRKVSGAWLREKRERIGMSQRELAEALGIDYYTFISQIESGRGKVPSDRYRDYARVLRVPPREFALVMLRNSEPDLYSMLFVDADLDSEPKENLLTVVGGGETIEDRLARLEAKLSK
ncbi:MAG: helix-turn-helix transcriptional regulator [Hoeflea sp.]|nr:helix-turn-helix transcriptional regulator [Hoeflea sp.]